MNLRPFTDNELTLKFSRLVRTERKITLVVLMYIAEIDRRKLYLKEAYPSLFEFLTKGHGYSPAAAQRRIDSARLLREIPQVAVKVYQGSINLSQLSKLQQAVRLTQKTQKRKVSSEEKVELISKFENTTHQETEKILSRELLMPVIDLSKETYHRDGSTTLTVTFTEEQMKNLEMLKDLLSHSVPSGKWQDLFYYLAGKALKAKLGKEAATQRPSKPSGRHSAASELEVKSVSKSGVADLVAHSRYIPAANHKAVFRKYSGCQYKDPRTGKVCGSRKFLEVDHIQPVWAGGSNDVNNLQRLCDAHNRYKYSREAGLRKL